MSFQTTWAPWGWAFWPAGDRYPLEPVWQEWHTCQSLTSSCRDEKYATLDVVLRRGLPWSITVTLTDLGEDLESEEDDTTPTAFHHAESRIWKEWGWSVERQMTVTPVMEAGVWTGQVEIGVDDLLLQELGTDVVHRYEVDVWIDDPTGPFPVRVMMGHLVVR